MKKEEKTPKERDFENYKIYSNQTFSKFNFTWNKNIHLYRNKAGRKCINEFEKQKIIGRGSSWKVYLAKRYFFDENKNIKTEEYAIKKTAIMVQYNRRYYKDDKLFNYLDKIYEEIEIQGILSQNSNEYVVYLYELIYDNEGKDKYNCLYLVNDYCDIGTIMNRDEINFNHFHNPLLIKHFYSDIEIKLEEGQNKNLVKKYSIPLKIKHKIAKILFKQILLGIKFIHSLNIAHRDIKIENLLFNSNDSKVKFIDFSISTIVKNKNKLINEPGGSMHYQSPDFFNLDNNGYHDPFKADLWAIGICLYIFIFEDFPFDSESELELGIKIEEDKLNYPFSPENEDYEKLLNAFLEKRVENRVTNIDELLNFNYFK